MDQNPTAALREEFGVTAEELAAIIKLAGHMGIDRGGDLGCTLNPEIIRALRD